MTGSPDRRPVQVVRGRPSAEEVAAVLAVLAARRGDGAAAAPTGYAAWRATRLAALRRSRA